MRSFIAALVLVSGVVLTACSDDTESSDDGESEAGSGGSSAAGGSTATGGSTSGTGLPSGTLCVSANSGAETCTSSGSRGASTVGGDGQRQIQVSHLPDPNADCQTHTATDSTLSVAIPDAQPFPYVMNQRAHYSNYASFKDPSCWYEGQNGVASGTIYQAGTNGSTHVEGDITMQHNSFRLRCGATCSDAASARFRFNVPL